MDQKKIGIFLKQLRKEKGLTQAQLAEKLNVSDRTVSRWETGYNMPDISMLVELSEFYHVDIREIMDGERKSESMEKETKDTVLKVAEYANEDKKRELFKIRRIVGLCGICLGVLIIMTAFTIFPSESSWGSIYAIFGSILSAIGCYQLLYPLKRKLLYSLLAFAVTVTLLFAIDYLAVVNIHQAPRFCYLKSSGEYRIEYKTPFYRVIRHHPDESDEFYEILPLCAPDD